MDKTMEARMLAHIEMPTENAESERDKYETSTGFGDLVQQQN